MEGQWLIMYFEGVENNEINDGEFWRNGMVVKMSTRHNFILLQTNTNNFFAADYIYGSDSTITVYNCEQEWFNGEYKIYLDHSKRRFDGMYQYMVWQNDSKLFQITR